MSKKKIGVEKIIPQMVQTYIKYVSKNDDNKNCDYMHGIWKKWTISVNRTIIIYRIHLNHGKNKCYNKKEDRRK